MTAVLTSFLTCSSACVCFFSLQKNAWTNVHSVDDGQMPGFAQITGSGHSCPPDVGNHADCVKAVGNYVNKIQIVKYTNEEILTILFVGFKSRCVIQNCNQSILRQKYELFMNIRI